LYQLKMSLLVSLGLFGGLLVGTTTGVQAAGGYQIVAQRPNWTKPVNYYVKNPRKSVIVWNGNHTKKLANLKTYPNTVWTSRYGHVLQHGKTKGLYVKITGYRSGNGAFLAGWVYRGHLTKGINPRFYLQKFVWLDNFKTERQYNAYIQHSPSQQLTKDIVALFPQSPVSLKLSDISSNQYMGDHSDWFTDSDDQPDSSQFKDVYDFKKINQYLYHHATLTDKQKLAYVKRQLAKAGYTTKRRATLKGYRLGICIVNDLPDRHGSLISDGYGIHRGYANNYSLMLGKPVK